MSSRAGAPEMDSSSKPTPEPTRKPVADPALASGLNVVVHVGSRGSKIVLSCLTRVTIEGALDRIPRSGPLIIASNHASNADGPFIGGWLIPRLGRRIHWLGKKEMLDWPILGWVFRSGSIHGVDRAAADIEAFRLLIRILDAGNVVVLFPEGTRSPDGTLHEAKDGIGLLALRTGAPILPVGLAGTGRFWPKGDRPHPGGRVTIRVGEPFRLADVLPPDADRKALKTLGTTAIMARIAALLPPELRGVYAEAAAGVAASALPPTGR